MTTNLVPATMKVSNSFFDQPVKNRSQSDLSRFGFNFKQTKNNQRFNPHPARWFCSKKPLTSSLRNPYSCRWLFFVKEIILSSRRAGILKTPTFHFTNMNTERIYLHIWGDLACFTRPEMKVERMSYPVPTPSAARGILEAILYKPQFRWRVHRIAVRRSIKFLSFRRNELKSVANSRKPEPILAEDDRTQRNTLALRDVDYVIEASLELNRLANQLRKKPPAPDEPQGDDNLSKYYGIFRRRVEKGQCFTQPCFGCREFPAHFELVQPSDMAAPPDANVDTDLGYILYDVFDLDIPANWKPGKVEKPEPLSTFFQARLENGIVNVPDWRDVKASVEA